MAEGGKMRVARAPWLLLLVAGLHAAPGMAAECTFVLNGEWNSGFTAAVDIYNPDPTPIDGWAVEVGFPDGSAITNLWDGDLSGGNPYLVTNKSYNGQVAPGQTIRFGFNASKPHSGAPAEIPAMGGICEASGGTPVNTPPTARASALPAEGDAPLTVRFDASASDDADGDALTYRWVFDDGSTSDGRVVSKTFEQPGTYETTLTVNDGRADSETVSVSVTARAPQPTLRYSLDAERSSLHFVSTKKRHVVESHHFTGLDGSVSDQGVASLTIDLNSVETGIGIRNERMREYLFETEHFPEARVTLDIAHLDIAAIVIGGTEAHDISAMLELHGTAVPISARLRVTRLTEATLLVQNVHPILIRAEDFALASGIEMLRELAGLNVISYAVPVNFTLVYDAP